MKKTLLYRCSSLALGFGCAGLTIYFGQCTSRAFKNALR
jgi:hypothetical protein